MKLNKAMNKLGIDLDLTVFIQNVLNNIVQPIILIEPFHIKNYSSNTYFNLNEYIIDLYSMCTEVSRELVSNSCCGNTEGYFIISEDQSEIVQNDFILEIYGIGNITDLILELVTDVAGGNCRRINKNCKCKKMDLQSDILQIEAAIFQFDGGNTIDNIDLHTNLTPSTNVAVTSTDCLEMTLQFKDPITGLNVGNSTTYSTNVGTNFSAADVLDWETSFGIFGGVQSWTGSDFSLIGWSKNTPQGAFLLPNPLLGYDISFEFQIKKNCGETITSNISTPVVAAVLQIAIADNGTNFLTPIPYTSDVTPIFPMGGIRLVEPINHPMVVYAVQGTCAGSPSLIGLQGTTLGTTIHNDGNWTMVNYERNYDNTVVTGSWAVPTGVEFRLAIVQTIGAAIGSATVGLIVPIINVEYPVLEYSDCIDGVIRLLAVDGTKVMETVKSIRLQNTNGLAIELVFNLIKSR